MIDSKSHGQYSEFDRNDELHRFPYSSDELCLAEPLEAEWDSWNS